MPEPYSQNTELERIKAGSRLCILLGLLVMLLAVGLLFFLQDPGQSMLHPVFSSMRHATGAWERLLPVRWASLLFILGMLGFFYGCMAFGIPGSLMGKGLFWYLVCCVLFAAVFYWTAFSHWSWAALGEEEALPVWFGMPAPTFLMIAGIWGLPHVFTVFYVMQFRKTVWNREQQEEFAELLSDMKETAMSGDKI